MRRATGTLALLAGSTLVALALAEGAVRLFWNPAPPALPPAATDPELAKLPVLDSVFDLMKPNVRGVHAGVLFRTNSAGFRGPEVSREPAPGSFRIVAVGDSFTMGSGVSEEDTYAARLEAALDARAPDGRDFEVLNLGLGGLNIRQVVTRLVKLGLPLHPDLVVYGFTVNDIEDRGDPKPVFPTDRSLPVDAWQRYTESPFHLVRFLWPRWVSLRASLGRDSASYTQRLIADYEDPAKWARITTGLDQLAALGRARGFCVHVLIHSVVADLYLVHPFTEIYDKLEAAARARGMTVSQSLPYYRWKRAGSLRVSALDGHPNAEGHRLLTEALLDGLRELPPRCGLALGR